MAGINLSALRKNSSKDLLSKLTKQVEATESKKFGGKDERFWLPTIDAAGNGSAIIRFLPARTEESANFVKLHRHSFQENGKWFITECATTIGQECFCCSENGKLWNSGLESDKEIARKRKRSTQYIANILIVKDPSNPANEGQIKLYRFGVKIFDKIKECFQVDEALGEDPKDPFAFFDGMNFNLKIQTVAKFLNYDKCKFVAAADLYDGDEAKLTEVLEGMHDLEALIAPSVFKPYEETKARYLAVVSGDSGAATAGSDFEEEMPPSKAQERFSKPKVEDDDVVIEKPKAAVVDEDDSDLDFFRKLAEM